MNDRERPKDPPAPTFEVPDLDLGVLPPRSIASPSAPSPRSAPATSKPSEVAPNMFDDDAFTSGSARIELSDATPFSSGAPSAYMGGEIDLGLGDDFELEPSSGGYGPPSTSGIQRVQRAVDSEHWPTGKPLPPEQVSPDPVQVQLLAAYGDPPGNPLSAPLYTYRVLLRRRDLQKQLRQTEATRALAEQERATALAVLAEQLRPELEKIERFRRLLEPLAALEQLAGERGRALASSNAEHAAKLAAYDAELAKLSAALVGELAQESQKRQACEACEANNKRSEAKLKRVQIEARSIKQVLEQKLGPQGGVIPPEEKKQLDELELRANGLQPELDQTRGELARARRELAEVQSRVEALHKGERQLSRQKQGLGQQFGKEVAQRSQGMREAEARRTAALAEIGVAVLDTRGGIAVPNELLVALRAADERAEKLQLAAAAELAALTAYDQQRYKQGFSVLLGALAAIALWIVFKVLASSGETP